MKQSDIISVALIGIIGFIMSYFIVNMLFDPNGEVVTYKTIDTIVSDLVSTDESVFNTNAINPTVEVFVGDCVDLNRDNVLDDEEKVLCNQIDVE